MSREIALTAIALCLAPGCVAPRADALVLHLRSRAVVKQTGDRTSWVPVECTAEWDPKRTALIICDMWDDPGWKGGSLALGYTGDGKPLCMGLSYYGGFLILPGIKGTFFAGGETRERWKKAYEEIVVKRFLPVRQGKQPIEN